MPIKIIKPVTKGQRNISYVDESGLTRNAPRVRSLLKRGKKIDGRSRGTITIRHRGGGTRPQYRIVDFNGREKIGVPGKIIALEYDPNRTAYIALVCFADGDKRYHLAHKGAKVGDEIITNTEGKPKDGMRLPLTKIPVGFSIFNLEITPLKGGQTVRSAGQSAKLISLDGDMAQVAMPSGEIRLVNKNNFATIGAVSNDEHSLERIGKAGRVRKMGRRPIVRGKVMNPVDHPHGGGEARNPIGMKHPKTPWGACALGVKTRNKKKATSRFILKSRHRANKK